jgi:hypothetical protein
MDLTYRMGRMACPMGCKSNRFSSFLLKLRKEAGDREAPGGCSSLSILPCAFVYASSLVFSSLDLCPASAQAMAAL